MRSVLLNWLHRGALPAGRKSARAETEGSQSPKKAKTALQQQRSQPWRESVCRRQMEWVLRIWKASLHKAAESADIGTQRINSVTDQRAGQRNSQHGRLTSLSPPSLTLPAAPP
jgi:hypothetical protein